MPRRRGIRDIAKLGISDPVVDNSTARLDIGLIYRTITPSPVVKWIFTARIRDVNHNDIVFVGDSFIHLKEIMPEGSLHPVASKINFPGRIKNATFIGQPLPVNEPENLDGKPFDGKILSKHVTLTGSIPPNMLVLVLDTDDLVFLFARTATGGRIHFVQSIYPLPRHRQSDLRLGADIATAPDRDAIAISARHSSIYLVRFKNWAELDAHVQDNPRNWSPVASESLNRILRKEPCSIQRMAFLRPREHKDHAWILALVVGNQRRSRFVCFNLDERLQTDDEVCNSNLDPELAGPDLMVPLEHTSRVILTTNGHFHISEEVFGPNLRFKSYDINQLAANDLEPAVLANSCYKPTFSGTLQAARSRLYAQAGKEALYLLRVDGVIISLDINGPNSRVPPNYRAVGRVETASAVGFAYPIFTNNLSDIEALVVSGYSGDGEMVSIGDKPSRKLDGRRDFMYMRSLQAFPNWAPTLDMVVTKCGESTAHSNTRASVLMASGQQPFGCVSEIRMGLEAEIWECLGLQEEVKLATGLWVINRSPEPNSKRIVVSSPSTTIIVDPFKKKASGFLDQRTFVIVEDGNAVLQIMQTQAVLRHSWNIGIPEQELGFGARTTIFAASVSSYPAALVVQKFASGHCLSLVQQLDGALQVRTTDFAQGVTPTSAAVFDGPPWRNPKYTSTGRPTDQQFIAILGTDHGWLHFYAIAPVFDPASDCERITHLESRQPIQLPTSDAIDSIAISEGHQLGDPPIVVCGTRGGILIYFPLCVSRPEDDSVQILQGPVTEVVVGRDPVSLTADTRSRANFIFATSGESILRISRDRHANSSTSLSVDSIWFTSGVKSNLRSLHCPVFSIDRTEDRGLFFAHELFVFAEGTLMTAKVNGTRGAIHRRTPLPWWSETQDKKPTAITYDRADADDEFEQPTPTSILKVRGAMDLAVGAKRAKAKGSRRSITGLLYFMLPDAATDLNGAYHASQQAVSAVLGVGEDVRCMCNWSPGPGCGDFIVVGTSLRLFFIMLVVKEERVHKMKIGEVKWLRNPVRCVAELPDGALAVCHDIYLDVYQSESSEEGRSIKLHVRTILSSPAVKLSWSAPYVVVSTKDLSFSVFRYRARTPTEDATLVPAYNDVAPRPSAAHEVITIPWPGTVAPGSQVDTLMGGVDEGQDHPESLTVVLAAGHDRSLTLHALHPRRPEDYVSREKKNAVVGGDEEGVDVMDVDGAGASRRRREQPHRAARDMPHPAVMLASTSTAHPLPYELTSLAAGDWRALHCRTRTPRDLSPSYTVGGGDGGGSTTGGFLLGDVDAVGTSPTGAAVHIGLIRGAHARALRFLTAALARLGSADVATPRGADCVGACDGGGSGGTAGGGRAKGKGKRACDCAARPVAWWEPARPLREAWRNGDDDEDEDGVAGVGEAVRVDLLHPLPYLAGAPAGVEQGAVWLEGVLRAGRPVMGLEARILCGRMERDLGVRDWVSEVVRLWRLAVMNVL